MILKIFSIVFLSCLLHLYSTVPSWAVESETKSEQSFFILKITDNLINLKAEQASLMDILRDLENQTEIKIKLFPGADDKRLTLNIRDLPIHEVHSLLEKMGVENFAVVYDQQLASKIIYILPAGKNINEIVKDKTKTILFSTHILNVNVAQLVAEDYLPKYYPGNWVFLNSFILYDLEGIPTAHTIIFRDANSKITTFEELNSTIKEIREKRDQRLNQLLQIQESKDLSVNIKREKLARLEIMTNKLKRALYQPDSFATVVTGATATSSPLIRCYRGLPSFFVKRADIEAELTFQYPNKNLQLGRVLYFNPFDIRYEVKEEDKLGVGPSFEEKLSQSVSDDSYTIFTDNDKIKLLSVVSERQKIKKQLDRKRKARKKMSIEKQRLLEESDKKKRQHYMETWAKYKREYIESSGQ